MNKNGFTLMELLAVIVILAVILVIAAPQIMSTIEKSRKGAIETTSKMITNAANKEYMKRLTLGTLDQDNNPIMCSDLVKLSSKDYGSCKVIFDSNGKPNVTLVGKGKFDKYKCVNNDCVEYTKEEVYNETILNGAYPRLDEGMIPVTISDTGVVESIDPSSSEWYSYAEKKWANVVLVKDDVEGKREGYKIPKTEIPESDIYAYLVWIPRYRYKLWNVNGDATTYSNGECVQNETNTNCPRLIDITFESIDKSKSTGTTNGSELTHPAFTYGEKKSNGIWVGKFETTGDSETPEIKPNVSALTGQNVSTQFATSIKFGTDSKYGIVSESRMSMNLDWGAIVYLSHSEYGVGTEIRLNNYVNSNYIGSLTGCGASAANKIYSTTCGIPYGSLSADGIFPQSTTGNIYGVFDMSGGCYEYQMGVLEDANHKARSGYNAATNSGYNGSLNGAGTYTNGVNLPIPIEKYYKLYNTSSFATNTNYLGEALGETIGWYSDLAYFVSTSRPWFMRGGNYSRGVNAGGFSFMYHYGNAGSIDGSAVSGISFRIIIG